MLHLHGHVMDDRPRRLIFSVVEYLNATEEAHAWHRVFGDSFVSSPYVIIGARLRDEYDLARVLRERRPSSGTPSLYVSPNITDGMCEDLKSWGFVPIRATGEDFVTELLEVAQPLIDEQIGSWGLSGQSGELLRFSQQFKIMESKTTLPESNGHDFYLGSPPEWSDIVANKDAIFNWTREGVRHAIENLEIENEYARLLIMWGARFSGRTTVLLRIAREMNRQHLRTFVYRGNERLDVEAAYSYIRDAGETVLIFDGLADFADDVDDLLRRCANAHSKVLIIAAENSRRAPLVLARISGFNLQKGNIIEIPRLDRQAARLLVGKLRDAGRLGKITPVKPDGQIAHFTRNGLFVGMAELESGSGFIARMRQEVDSLGVGWEARLVLLASLIETLNYSVPVQLAAGATGVNVEEILKRVTGDNSLSALMEVDNDLCLHPRMRILLVDELIQRLGNQETAQLLGSFVRYARPYINPRTQSIRSTTARIVAGLMRAKSLMKWLGLANLDKWYESMLPYYGWNGKYREQRAIAASLSKEYGLAESFAEKAVTLAPDSFRYNTLGNMLLDKAAALVQLSESEAERVYLRAREFLDKAYDLDKYNIVPLLSFLENSMKILRGGLSVQSGLYETISNDWSDRYADAQLRHSARVSNEVRDNLALLSRRWQALAS